MKKTMRCFICAILAVTIMLCSTLTAFAEPSDNTEAVAPTAEFIKLCGQVFAGNGEVYDSNGTDVTNGFVARYNAAYQSEDFESILLACYEEGISQIVGYEYTELQNLADAGLLRADVVQCSYNKMVAHLVTNSAQPFPGKTWYIIVEASGVYSVVNAYPVVIVDFPSPEIKISYSGEGAGFAGSLTSMTTSPPVTKHTMSCPIPGVDYLTGTLGPFSNVSYFTIYA